MTTITSMTGFARREASGPWGTLVCELRSVNHRFLEASFRLPDELRATEPELRQRLAREVKRGKVDCSMSARRVQAASASLEVDAQALERLMTRVREIARVLPEHTVNVLDILRWPGVLRDESGEGDELLVAARALFDGTLEDLVAARAREGVRLRELLDQRCTNLEGLVSHVRARLPDVHARVRARLNERLAELQANVDHDRLEQELALLLQRLDVDEELDRLSGHVVEIRRVIHGCEPAGRRLDFLMQELNREANTLSSKSQDLETTRSAVDMKVIIEQMREQVQNVE
ncbi:MAG TPA: YicC/YloC family endoribonuclease [Steroidobacteraceae bacterium]|nr:YicC/YloC family endoribonuclease [Steroidobacteraceae bacterium]